MGLIRVFIVDDHNILREGLRRILETHGDIKVVGEASDGVEALRHLRTIRPDILLLDISMPRMSGLETISLVKNASPDTKTIILSMYRNETYAKKALESGALGYVLKGASTNDLLTAIRAVHRGEYYLSANMHADIIEAYLKSNDRNEKQSERDFDHLTEREKQVFHLLVEGNSTIQISKILCISNKTVEKHRTSITNKLGISNLATLVKYAIRIGVIDPDGWKT